MEKTITKKIAKKLPLRYNASVSGSYVYFQNKDQYIVISVVLDKYATSENPDFYLHCGVHSVEIIRFRGERFPGDFSWQIQPLADDGQPKWHKEEYESLDDVIDRVVRKLTDDVIPQLLVIDDDWLIDLWSTGSMQGIGELQRLEFLTILLRHKGRWEECERVCQEMIEFGKKLPRVRWIHGHVRKVLSQ